MIRTIALVCLGFVPLLGQKNSTITAPFSDPERPGMVKVQQANGSIAIRGYSGKTVLIEFNPSRKRRPPMEATIREDGNVMTISGPANSGFSIQVPFQTSLQLSASNGSILVEKVLGELDVQSENGSIDLRGAAGAVVAHSQNGSIVVTFEKVDPRKPMSFSSMNGKIDVTFPANLKASFNVKNDRGPLYSDFDMQSRGGTPEIQIKNYNGGIYIRKAGK